MTTTTVALTPSVSTEIGTNHHPSRPHTSASKPPAFFRLVRVTVAVPLIALSGWCLMPFALVPVSSLAVVNARLSRMRSPVTGEALQTPLEAGDSVKLDEEIVQLRTSSPVPPDTNPAELERSRKDLTAQAASIDGQILAAQQRLQEYETSLREYSSRMGGEVNIRLRDADHAVVAAQESCARAQEELKRSEQLEKEGLRAASFSAEARRKLAIEQRELDARKTAFEELKVQAENLKAGYFVGQGVEQPRYLALRDETRAELGKLQRDREVLKSQLKSADHDMVTTLAKPQETVAKNLVMIKSPVNGVIWSREVSAGQAVNETDDLFQVADSGSLHVDAWVDRRYGPQLSIGDEALVYLTGNGKQLIGRVVAIQASSHRRLDEFTTAIDLQPPHPDQYRVIIQLDAADRSVAYLGQSAKVMFPGPRASMATRFYFWVTHL